MYRCQKSAAQDTSIFYRQSHRYNTHCTLRNADRLTFFNQSGYDAPSIINNLLICSLLVAGSTRLSRMSTEIKSGLSGDGYFLKLAIVTSLHGYPKVCKICPTRMWSKLTLCWFLAFFGWLPIFTTKGSHLRLNHHQIRYSINPRPPETIDLTCE